jgi:MFS family permease
VRYPAQIGSVLRTVFRNADLRRIELAFAGFNGAEWATWIAMLVYAYEQGGAAEAGVVALVQLVPAALFAPFAAALADRYPPVQALVFGYVAQGVAMGATASVLLAGASSYLAYALAAVAATAVTITRPTQSALVPALVRSPDQLTATNVVSGWIESVSVLLAPAGAGVLLAVGSPGVVFAVAAAIALAAGVLVGAVHGPPAAPEAPTAMPLSEALAGFGLLAHEREPRLLVLLLGVQYVVIGTLDVLYVVLAIGVLERGESWAGYLNAAFGAGGVLGVVATVALVGRRRLMPALVFGVVLWSAALVVLGLSPTALGALFLLAVAGVGRSLLDVAGRTLLQRACRPGLLSRVFGVLEGASMAGLAAGSVLAPVLIALGDARGAFIGVAILLPLVVLLAGRRLLGVDARADVPIVQIGLLRSLPLFSPLGAVTLEGIARQLDPVVAAPGTAVVKEGELGDRFYVVADGQLDVMRGDARLARLRRGDGFGEIALVLDVPRTATVTARTDALLYALKKDRFLECLAIHPASSREAQRLVDERLRAGAPAGAKITQ